MATNQAAEMSALISDILLHGVRPRLEWCEQLAAYAKEQAERADAAEMKSERLEAELAAGREERSDSDHSPEAHGVSAMGGW